MRAFVLCPWALAACNVACANSSGGNPGDASLGGQPASSQSGSSGSVSAEPDAATDDGVSGSSTASSSSYQGAFDAAVDSGDAAGLGPCDPSMTTPIVLQISPDGGFYQGLAIDDAWVYFGQGSYGVRRIAKTGGSFEDFVPGDASVEFVTLAPLTSPVVNGDDVYWVTDAEGVLRVGRSSFTAARPRSSRPCHFRSKTRCAA
jgi:hypothetical protein